MDYRVDDKQLNASVFLEFVNQIWPGSYDVERTQAALSRTLNITAYDDAKLTGCLRILSDGYYFGTITELLVLPEYQRKGIGSKLLQLAKENTPTMLYFGSQPGTECFYEKNGCRKGMQSYTIEKRENRHIPVCRSSVDPETRKLNRLKHIPSRRTQFMDSFVNEKDFALLRQDYYTFEVLARILKGECELIRSNHENLLICHSESHYHVWIWTPDNAADEVKKTAWELLCDLRPLSSGYRYNLKYELAEYFAEKAAGEGSGAGISMNMFVYDCPSPIPPDAVADGCIYCCTPEDEEEAAAIIPHFYTEIGEEEPSHEQCLEKVRNFIAGKGFFFWKNKNGKTVACCSCKLNDRFASISSVYTFPDERRKHYAQNLVYQVTRKASETGYIPILYTDADYQASNACYEKIGYILRGKLCTVAIIN